MIVIDTHIWIWYLDKPDLLSEKAFAVVEHAKERKAIYVSSISVWEIYVLEKIGRLQFSIQAVALHETDTPGNEGQKNTNISCNIDNLVMLSSAPARRLCIEE